MAGWLLFCFVPPPCPEISVYWFGPWVCAILFLVVFSGSISLKYWFQSDSSSTMRAGGTVSDQTLIYPVYMRKNKLWLWFPCPKKPGEVPGNLKMFYVYESFNSGSTVSRTLIWYLQMMPKSVLFGPSWRGRCVRCAWCEPQRCCSHGT